MVANVDHGAQGDRDHTSRGGRRRRRPLPNRRSWHQAAQEGCLREERPVLRHLAAEGGRGVAAGTPASVFGWFGARDSPPIGGTSVVSATAGAASPFRASSEILFLPALFNACFSSARGSSLRRGEIVTGCPYSFVVAGTTVLWWPPQGSIGGGHTAALSPLTPPFRLSRRHRCTRARRS